MQYKLAAAYSTAIPKVLRAFIISADLFGIAPSRSCAFPRVITILVNPCTLLILGVFPAVMVFALCISPPHPVAAVRAQLAFRDPWPTMSEFLPSSICIASKESCWIVHLHLFWISEAVLLLWQILWHKQNPFFLIIEIILKIDNFVPFLRNKSYLHYCIIKYTVDGYLMT